MSKIWKGGAILALVLLLAGAGTVMAAQEHQHEATQEEAEQDAASMEEMESSHDMGSMMAMMKEMMASMHKHMAMMHAMMEGTHGEGMEGMHAEGKEGMHGEGMEGMHAEGKEGMHGEGMEGMHAEGKEGMHGEGMEGMHAEGKEGMQGMMSMPDPAGIEDAAEATAQADKLAKHLEMMKTMMPKLEKQLEALRQRAEELSGSETA